MRLAAIFFSMSPGPNSPRQASRRKKSSKLGRLCKNDSGNRSSSPKGWFQATSNKSRSNIATPWCILSNIMRSAASLRANCAVRSSTSTNRSKRCAVAARSTRSASRSMALRRNILNRPTHRSDLVGTSVIDGDREMSSGDR